MTDLDAATAAADAELHPWNAGFEWPRHDGPYRRVTPEQAKQYDEDGYFLRSRCHLVPLEAPRCEFVGATTQDVEAFSLTSAWCQQVFDEARQHAKKLGLSWKVGIIELTPSEKLCELVRRSDEKVRAEGSDDAGD